MRTLFRIGDKLPSTGARRATILLAQFLALSMALMLMACMSGQPDTPRATANAMPSVGESGSVSDVIFVVPPEGAPLQTGLVLADAIAAEIRDSNHPAILAYQTNQAGASVVGKVLSAVPRGNVTWLTMDWAIRAPYGTFVDTYRQRVVIDKDMWDRAAPEAINLVIADAAPRIVQMVNSQVGPPAMASMTHRNWRDQSNEDQFKDKSMIEKEMVTVANKSNATTMSARMAEQSTIRQTTAADERPQVAGPEPVVQPLARIADATNGQVVRAEGVANLPQNDLESLSSMATSESPRPPLPSLLTLPPIEEPETAPTGGAKNAAGRNIANARACACAIGASDGASPWRDKKYIPAARWCDTRARGELS